MNKRRRVKSSVIPFRLPQYFKNWMKTASPVLIDRLSLAIKRVPIDIQRELKYEIDKKGKVESWSYNAFELLARKIRK